MKTVTGSLLAFDDAARTDHAFLTAADQCRCLAEYQPGRGYRASRVNELMLNLKCAPPIAAIDPCRRYYKLQAIADIAHALRCALNRSAVECVTWIPVPPSRPACDADYDDRLQRILVAAFSDFDLGLRCLLHQSAATAADHASVRRLPADALYRLIGVDREALELRPLRESMVLFDDVLTTGKRYKCCERRLREVLAEIPVSGLFVARRVLPHRRGCAPPGVYAGSALARAPSAP